MTRDTILALILAGGEGGRLELLTEGRAKPATPFGGTYRLIDFPLSNCMNSGISDVWVLQQFQPHSLTDHLANGRPWDLDRTYGGMQILHPELGTREGGWYQGNADAIHKSRAMIRALDPDLVLVLSADHVYRLDYRDVVERHLAHDARATLVTTTVPRDQASRFGNVRAGRDGRVEGFAYKPDEPLGEVVTTEVFLYDAAVLMDTLDDLAADQDDDEGLDDFGDALLPRLVEEGGVFEHRLDGYWKDVGTVDAYHRAHMDLLEDPPPLELGDPAWPVRTAAPQRRPALVLATARVDRSLVAPGSRVAGAVTRSVVGPGVVVEEGAEVRDTVLLDDAHVAAGARVTAAIVDAGAHVAERAVVGADAGASPGADDIAMVGAGARLAAGERVEPGARRARG